MSRVSLQLSCSIPDFVMLSHINLLFRITNKWIRWKPQELSLPCKRHNNGWDRLAPLDKMFCRNSDQHCVEDKWSRDKEIFFYPSQHFSVLQAINSDI